MLAAIPRASSNASGICCNNASGKANRHSRMAQARISQARSRRSDSQPSGHCTSSPAKMQAPMYRPTCSLGSPNWLAYSGARP